VERSWVDGNYYNPGEGDPQEPPNVYELSKIADGEANTGQLCATYNPTITEFGGGRAGVCNSNLGTDSYNLNPNEAFTKDYPKGTEKIEISNGGPGDVTVKIFNSNNNQVGTTKTIKGGKSSTINAVGGKTLKIESGAQAAQGTITYR